MSTYQAKVVVVGRNNVGKTCLVNRYIKGKFVSTTNTIGGCMERKEIPIGQDNVILHIWDTAGQERFRSMAPMYYRNADCAILCFDVTDEKTLDTIEDWKLDVLEHANEDVKLLYVGNKIDLLTEESDTSIKDIAQDKSKDAGATLHYTSAKHDEGIDELFDSCARQFIQLSNQRKNGGSSMKNNLDNSGSNINNPYVLNDDNESPSLLLYANDDPSFNTQSSSRSCC